MRRQLDGMHAADDEEEEDPYKSFNLLVRRKPEENNFKGVLETVRDLMSKKG